MSTTSGGTDNLGRLLSRLDRPRRSGAGYVARCPAHDDHHPSLSIAVLNGRILLHCFAGCKFRDVLAALGLSAWDLPTMAGALSFAEPTVQQRLEYARAIWRRTGPIAGTVAERYLRECRGIKFNHFPPSLRFARFERTEAPGVWPHLVVGIQDCAGKFRGIARTALANDGSSKAPSYVIDPVRQVFGPYSGGCVRLGPVAETIALGEGVETMLSVAQACPELSCWAALSATNMPRVELPIQVREVIIAADADEVGELAARGAAVKFLREGRRVKIARPQPGYDFNDYLTA